MELLDSENVCSLSTVVIFVEPVEMDFVLGTCKGW